MAAGAIATGSGELFLATGVESMSLAMHKKHSTVASIPACYDCHPGAKTQCNRSAIEKMGPLGTDPQCKNCHGDLKKVAADLVAGRKPWLQEPTCQLRSGVGLVREEVRVAGSTAYEATRLRLLGDELVF